MSTKAFAHPSRSLTCVGLCVTLASACDPAPVPTTPAPTPESIQYSVSGIVMDAADAPAARANVMLRHNEGMLVTRTDANGAYAFSFRTSQPYQNRAKLPEDFLGLLIVGDDKDLVDIRHAQWTTVQLLPWGKPDVDVRPGAGGDVPTLTCPYVGCPAWRVQGTISIPVEARWSPFHFSVEIPRASAPQRYHTQTSLR